MKKSFLILILIGLVGLLTPAVHAQIVGSINTNNFALITTNYNVTTTNGGAAATIPVPGLGTQEWDIVIQNFGSNTTLYTEDGSAPSATHGLRLEPYRSFDTFSNNVVNPASQRKINNRQTVINITSTNLPLGGLTTNRNAVVQRLWVPLKVYPGR